MLGRGLACAFASIMCLAVAYYAGAGSATAQTLGTQEIAAVDGVFAAIAVDGRVFTNRVSDDSHSPKWTYSGRLTGLTSRPISILATTLTGSRVVVHVVCADGRHYRLALGKDYRSLGPVLPDTTQLLADIFADAREKPTKN